MFTGIVQGLATVAAIREQPGLHQFDIDLAPRGGLGLIVGASVAINGTCLTVVSVVGDRVTFDAMTETLTRTNLSSFYVGQKVNYERAARIGDEIGGHLVSGHINTVATIESIERDTLNCHITFRVPDDIKRYLFPKGFVALNGASLTIGVVNDTLFDVWLIPETLRMTTFGTAKVGDKINLEVDNHAQAIVDTLDRMGLSGLLSKSV